MHPLVLILNGPNLNLLGQRQPEIYGHATLADVARDCAEIAARHGAQADLRQSNHEGQIIDWIHEARGTAAGIIINPGALSHTSVAILDALNAYDGPVIEVHISNIHRRESFRHHSYVSLRADAVIAGCGVAGYSLGLGHLLGLIGGRAEIET
ncbi:MAG: type II 3-dehydroquinate dehydratase [Rubellimicrobium sp.]|nr:type II 3-dehydroquinate dehydratase [Rubellimicrobium sp.]